MTELHDAGRGEFIILGVQIEDEDSDSTELAEVLPDEASGLEASNFSG
jgi:hypothetical protein